MCNRRPARWRRPLALVVALFLVIIGGIFGYSSLNEVGKGIWGGGFPDSQTLQAHQNHYLIVFFLGATAFISGILFLVGATIKAAISALFSAKKHDD